MHTDLTGTAETSRLSPRNGFTAYTCSPRGSGLSCPRCRRKDSRQRSARVAAPGPHDFAVRCRVFVRCACAHLTPQRPSHPVQRFVTIAKRPSGDPGADNLLLICVIVNTQVLIFVIYCRRCPIPGYSRTFATGWGDVRFGAIGKLQPKPFPRSALGQDRTHAVQQPTCSN